VARRELEIHKKKTSLADMVALSGLTLSAFKRGVENWSSSGWPYEKFSEQKLHQKASCIYDIHKSATCAISCAKNSCA